VSTRVTWFTDIAARYRQTSSLQRSAAERLFDLLDLQPGEAVLDLGCGTGHITAEIHARTGGLTVGVDPSPQMIAEARRGDGSSVGALEFVVAGAEDLCLPGRFDAIFCNSALQWFHDPARALRNCRDALRPGGRMAAQAPATSRYCPNFVAAFARLGEDDRTRATWARFRVPWFMPETAEGYAEQFAAAGFRVELCVLEQQEVARPPAVVMEMFESGAAQAYLNPACYDGGWPEGFAATARDLIADEFTRQAEDDGIVRAAFTRLYVLARSE
jgi:ubiquinone/menaquinone biosynthesis C-methylase UbiE